MADPVTKALEDINRTLKEIASNQKEQIRVLKAIHHNYLVVNQKPGDELEVQPPEPSESRASVFGSAPVPPPYTPKFYGWSMAALVQRDGALRKGDMKQEQDESFWAWSGDTWERIEEPSAREPD